jgi:hypothetical protein
MNIKTIVLAILIAAFFAFEESHGQHVVSDMHNWEMHINYWAPRVGIQASTLYPYMLKRNVRIYQKPGAWRVMLSPFSDMLDASDKTDTIFNWTKVSWFEFGPMMQGGYEWQKWLGNSMLYYGADLGWRTRRNVGISHDYSLSGGIITINQRKLKNQTSDAWLAGLAGMKYYVGSRFSLSLETQLQVRRTIKTETFSYAGKRMYKDKETTVQIIPFSNYLFNLSYNF